MSILFLFRQRKAGVGLVTDMQRMWNPKRNAEKSQNPQQNPGWLRNWSFKGSVKACSEAWAWRQDTKTPCHPLSASWISLPGHGEELSFMVWTNWAIVTWLGHTSKKQCWGTGLKEDTNSLPHADPRGFVARPYPLGKRLEKRINPKERVSRCRHSGASNCTGWHTFQLVHCRALLAISLSPTQRLSNSFWVPPS